MNALLLGGTGVPFDTATKSPDVVLHPLLARPFNQHPVRVPGLAFQVRRGAVVDDATVERPSERPLGMQAQPRRVVGDAAADGLLGRVERSVVVGPEAGVDPHAAGRGAVGLEVRERAQQIGRAVLEAALGVVVAVEGPGHGARVDLAVNVVVPLRVETGSGATPSSFLYRSTMAFHNTSQIS